MLCFENCVVFLLKKIFVGIVHMNASFFVGRSCWFEGFRVGWWPVSCWAFQPPFFDLEDVEMANKCLMSCFGEAYGIQLYSMETSWSKDEQQRTPSFSKLLCRKRMSGMRSFNLEELGIVDRSFLITPLQGLVFCSEKKWWKRDGKQFFASMLVIEVCFFGGQNHRILIYQKEPTNIYLRKFSELLFLKNSGQI